MFALRWQTLDGSTFRAWLHLGESAGNFRLSEFDPANEILLVKDELGHSYRLVLPGGKVRQESLTDQEYSELYKYMLKGADWKDAPILSREKARAFYLRMIRQRSAPENVKVVFDVDGKTLTPQRQATWARDKAVERAGGQLLLAVIVDGVTEIHGFPLHPYQLPDQMTRNLLDADWDEIALLDATMVLKYRLARRK
jgi:hypothetical protein